MSWDFDTVEAWVNTALTNLGYTPAQAQLGACSVTWLQQRQAPGVAAMAQHIDFISAYKFTPAHGGDSEANCPVVLSETLQSHSEMPAQVFQKVRQPLLLLPTLARIGGIVRWNDFEADSTQGLFDIEYERKSLRQVLLPNVDVQWTPLTSTEQEIQTPNMPGKMSLSDAPSNRHPPLPEGVATKVLPRELVYVKTLQHYAGALPPPEPLDNTDDSDNTSSA